MEINTSAFNGTVSTASGFNDFLDVVQRSPTLATYINAFSMGNGSVQPSGSGSYTESARSIYIQANEFPVAGDEASVLRFAGVLAHELGHAVLNGGMLSDRGFNEFLNAPNAERAADIQLAQEGTANYLEYLVSSELGTQLRGGDQLKATLDRLAVSYGQDVNGFREAAIKAGIDTYRNTSPSTAPHITYGEYYGDSWYAIKAGLQPNNFSWQTVYSNDIVATDVGNGIVRIVTSRPMGDGTRTSTFSMDMNSSGDVVKNFVNSTTYDGFRYAQVAGEGVYYLNDTIVTARQADNNGLYASVIGNGNDIYVFDGNEIRLVGDNNFLSSQNSDHLTVDGEHNTLDINGYIDSIVVNDVSVPNDLDGISYVGDTAIGFGDADVGFGNNFPSKGYEVPEVPQQNRGATIQLNLPAPSDIIRAVGVKEVLHDELLVI